MKSFIQGLVLLLVSALSLNASVISGIVTNVAGDTALSGIAIALKKTTSGTATVARDTTDADGAYSVTWDTAGTYVVRTTDSTSKYVTQNDTVTITDASADIALNIKMSHASLSSIAGIIADSSNDAMLSGAIVTLRTGTGTGGSTKRDTTGADGAYSFDSVTTGTYTVSVSADGYIAKSSSVTLGATAQTVDFKLVAAVYCTVNGTITDSATGAALSGAGVILRSNGQTIDSMVTDSSGTYTLDSAITGDYIKVVMAGYTTKRDTLTVTSSVVQTVNIKLDSAKTNIILSSVKNGLSVQRTVSVTANRALCLNNFNGAGVVFLYSANGRLVCKQTFCANSAATVLPFGRRLAGGGYVIRITQKAGVFTGRIVLP
jgi:large repetitive protein